MPYSDNLYSMVDDDSDLDLEPIDHVLNQQAPYGQSLEESLGQFQSVQVHRQDLPFEGEAGASHGHGVVNGHTDEELYDDLDVETDDVFSPTDGYFRAALETGTSPSASLYPPPLPLPLTAGPAASNTPSQLQQGPHVPNVWVQDPSLGQGNTAESKAREADQERHTSATSSQPASSSPPPSPPAAAAVASCPAQYAYSYRYQPSSSSSAYNSSSSGAPYTSYTRRPQPPYYNNVNSHFFTTPSEAPPAYTPSPTSPTSSDTSHLPSRNYRTFEDLYHNTPTTMTEGVLAREPESMGGPMTPGPSSLSWRERLRRWLSKLNWKLVLGILLVFLVTIGFLTGLGVGMSNDKSNRLIPPIKEPVTEPDNPPMDPRPPGSPDNDDEFQWRSGWGCKSDKIARPVDQFEVSFGADRALNITQDVVYKDNQRASHYRHVQVQGEIIIRQSVESGSPNSAIVLQVSVSDDRINVDAVWEPTEQTLLVTVPSSIPWDQTPEGPCVNILATVWVPKDGVLDNLRVKTSVLGISLYDNLSLSVSEDTHLSSTSGHIISASTGIDDTDNQIYDTGRAPDTYQFRSRRIEAKTTSAPIKGSWPLLDYLGLISTSGTIKASIEPKEADKDKPAPALLFIKSFSGDVEFREPIQDAQDAFTVSQAWKEAGREAEVKLHPETVLPPRDYRVVVHTTSGNIRGSVAFSSSAEFQSTSGNMHLDLLPVLDLASASGGQKMSSLTTRSTSGNDVLYMLEPLWVGEDEAGMGYVPFASSPNVPVSPGPVDTPAGKDGNEPTMIIASSAAALKSINSHHSLTSGDMNLHYPAAWEGELRLETMSGKLTAVGEGVDEIDRSTGFPKYVLCRKGPPYQGGSRFTAKTTSGDIFVQVGNK